MKAFILAIVASAVAAVKPEDYKGGPLIHPDTGLAITTTGYHWYGQEPLALVQLAVKPEDYKNGPLVHPDTGLAITTTGYHWYGQEPLALNKKQAGVRFINDPVL